MDNLHIPLSSREMELLEMPKNIGTVPMVQWPLFLLASKLFVAKNIAGESDSQDDLWDRISRDEYMKYVVEECFYSIQLILTSIFDKEGKLCHKEAGSPELERGVVNAALDLYDVIQLDFFSGNMRESYATWNMLIKARKAGRLFSNLKWPRDHELRSQIRRLHSLLTIKDSAVNVPRNLEARRRWSFLQIHCSCQCPSPGLFVKFYLLDEWKNFLARIGRDENTPESDLIDNEDDNLELSARNDVLQKSSNALSLSGKDDYMEAAIPANEATDTKGFKFSPEARAHANLKFTYVVTCQIYGKQKEEQKPVAADIALLLQRNEALRVAFIDEVETLTAGKVHKEFFSKLVKGDINGKDKGSLANPFVPPEEFARSRFNLPTDNMINFHTVVF
ncbi:hypothetical protein L2E82_24446 [Cichorium intybus]|uniref:Uncharacterized protein n=1 Tax=Cichorium intybus TaxID=13427 RepID=A0ACB9E0R3_CICIN|nr:hypothetical protein L2E82_24446 [Cichorium intybus]